jgi:electron transfer flavoprotein beta subunit
MHFVCCLKQVPDTAEIKIDPQTNTLVRSGVASISNPFDLVALEAALRLKDQYGAYITALTMGPPQSGQVLREALSLGADDAVLLTDRLFAGADTLATSYTLFKAIEKLNAEKPVDLIFCGKQAIDGDTGQTGPGLSARLGYNLFTYVAEIQELDRIKRQIRVKRKIDGGAEVIQGNLPALLTVELELGKPRRASLPLLINSQRARLSQWDHQSIDGEPLFLGLKGSATWVRRIFTPPMHAGGPKYVFGEDPQGTTEKFLDLMLSDPVGERKLTDAEE